jgi:PBSX family phage terminase large subunit
MMQIQGGSPKQKDASNLCTHRLNVWEGAVRSGKTFSSEIAWLRFVGEGPGGPLLMVGKNERTLRRNVIDPLTEMLGTKRCRYVQNSGVLWLCGRRVYVVGANDERAQEKIRGLTLAGAYVDEASTLPESFWSMLLSRLSVLGARLFATTNPDSPLHWLKRDYLDRAAVWMRGDGEMILGDEEALDLARFSFRLADNETLGAEYIKQISREYTGLWRRRFIDGEWVAAEGAIYELDVAPGGPHVVSKLPELRMLRLAIDYGTTNPFVALLMGVSAEPRLYVAREWRYDSKGRRTMTDGEYVDALSAWIATGADGFFADENGRGLPVPLEKVVIDPSAASFRAAWQRRHQRWPEAADNAVLDGIRDTASLLASGRLAFHESCKTAIAEHSGYAWDSKAQAKGEDAPLKQADHAPDACRYGVRSYRTVWRHWLGLPLEAEEAA